MVAGRVVSQLLASVPEQLGNKKALFILLICFRIKREQIFFWE